MSRRPAPRARPAQRGAALLLALLLVALVATLASAMVWQQWRAVQVEAAERARAQAAWVLDGATDWSRLILREDARTGSNDHAAEPWATPLAEARLSTAQLDKLFDAFAIHESEVIGPGRHEALHEMLGDLGETFTGTTPLAVPHR